MGCGASTQAPPTTGAQAPLTQDQFRVSSMSCTLLGSPNMKQGAEVREKLPLDVTALLQAELLARWGVQVQLEE